MESKNEYRFEPIGGLYHFPLLNQQCITSKGTIRDRISSSTRSRTTTIDGDIDLSVCDLSRYEIDECKEDVKESVEKTLDNQSEGGYEESQDGMRPCKECGAQLLGSIGLCHHMEVYHSEDRRYACGKCLRRFSAKERLVNHILKYNFNCILSALHETYNGNCANEISGDLNIDESKRYVDNNPKRKAIYTKRDKTYKSKEYLRKADCISNDNIKDTDNYLSIDRNYVCCNCDLPFDSKVLLEEHLKGCNSSFNMEMIGVPEKIIQSETNVKTNIISGPNKKAFICDVCENSFKTRKYVIIHIKENHGAEKPILCNICNRGFFSYLDLGIHRSVHKDDKQMVCNTCGKSYSSKNNFECHVLRCQKNVLFKCKICEKELSSPKSLKVHYLQHDPVKRFSCKFCKKIFRHNHHLTIHVRALHTNFKPYECGICKKRFSRSSVIQHLRTHSDERPFKCDICSKRFKRKHHLKMHKITVHNGTLDNGLTIVCNNIL